MSGENICRKLFAKVSQSFLLTGEKREREAALAQIRAAVKPTADIIDVSPPGKSISLNQIKREVMPLIARKRTSKDRPLVLVVNSADALTQEAQNLLLKMVEEPPHSTYLLFSTRFEQSLLPTLLSRLSRLFAGSFAIPSDQLGGGIKERLRHKLADSGSLSDKDLDDIYKLLSEPASSALALVKAMGMDASKATALASTALLVARQKLALVSGRDEFARWLRVQEQCLKVNEMLRANINPVLAADKIILVFHGKL